MENSEAFDDINFNLIEIKPESWLLPDNKDLPSAAMYMIGSSEYMIYEILYERGIYKEECFETDILFGLPVNFLALPDIRKYIDTSLEEAFKFIKTKELDKVVLCIYSFEDGELLDKWVFDIDYTIATKGIMKFNNEDFERLQNEMVAAKRQIKASCQFTEPTSEDCFKIQIHVKDPSNIPEIFCETSPEVSNFFTEPLTLVKGLYVFPGLEVNVQFRDEVKDRFLMDYL